ncbi:hypothetical protein J1614_005486 [Plenodomus biglobosus]|nr:hypothetical protein J1614_005486 [Plenodomus biglobosus]
MPANINNIVSCAFVRSTGQVLAPEARISRPRRESLDESHRRGSLGRVRLAVHRGGPAYRSAPVSYARRSQQHSITDMKPKPLSLRTRLLAHRLAE